MRGDAVMSVVIKGAIFITMRKLIDPFLVLERRLAKLCAK